MNKRFSKIIISCFILSIALIIFSNKSAYANDEYCNIQDGDKYLYYTLDHGHTWSKRLDISQQRLTSTPEVGIALVGDKNIKKDCTCKIDITLAIYKANAATREKATEQSLLYDATHTFNVINVNNVNDLYQATNVPYYKYDNDTVLPCYYQIDLYIGHDIHQDPVNDPIHNLISYINGSNSNQCIETTTKTVDSTTSSLFTSTHTASHTPALASTGVDIKSLTIFLSVILTTTAGLISLRYYLRNK